MGCLSGEGDFSIKGVEGHPQFDKVSNAVGSFIYQDSYCLLITQAISGSYSILKVKLRGIVFADGGSDTPLRVFSIAVINAALGSDEHTSLLFSQQGSIKPGDTTTYYNIVILAHWTYRLRLQFLLYLAFPSW